MIELADVTKIYPMGSVEVRALDGVSLRIEGGEFVAIVGASGSGKSTMMHLIGCLDRPTAGTLRFLDQAVGRLNDRQLARLRNRSIGFVFQSFNLVSRMSAWENVALPLFYARRTITKPAALEALNRVNLAGRADHQPNELSGGERQRVAIARAIVNRPPLILADEPTGNLDTRTGEQIMAIFHELHREGATVVLVTHEPDIAAQAERVITMRDGRIVEDRLEPSRDREGAFLPSHDRKGVLQEPSRDHEGALGSRHEGTTPPGGCGRHEGKESRDQGTEGPRNRGERDRGSGGRRHEGTTPPGGSGRHKGEGSGIGEQGSGPTLSREREVEVSAAIALGRGEGPHPRPVSPGGGDFAAVPALDPGAAPGHPITTSPDRQIARSPDHQITKSPDRQIARSPDHPHAVIVHPGARRALAWALAGPISLMALVGWNQGLRPIKAVNPGFARMIGPLVGLALMALIFVAPMMGWVRGRAAARAIRLAPQRFGGLGRARAAQWLAAGTMTLIIGLTGLIIGVLWLRRGGPY